MAVAKAKLKRTRFTPQPIESNDRRVGRTNKVKAPFKVNTLVTGIDKSYARSIYRLVKIEDELHGQYRIVSLSGRLYKPRDPRGKMRRMHSEFEIASYMQIKISSDAKNTHYHLVKFLAKLGLKSCQ
jgi:hypothetical protein